MQPLRLHSWLAQTADVGDAIELIASYLEQRRRGGQAFVRPMVDAELPPVG